MKQINFELETKYSMLLGVVFSHRINPNDGQEYFLDLNDPNNKEKFIRWDMKLTDKKIHDIWE